ncbi:class I histocompatibility antigen, F10 alpha chain-like, partial [Lates japonicus]
MSVDLKSTPAPGEKYECVFQLSGVKEDIIKRLDKAEIRTNWKTSSDVTVPIIAAVVVVALVLIAVIGFVVYKRKNSERSGKSEKSTQQKSETSSCSSDDSAKESDKALMKDPDTLSFKSYSSTGESAGSTTPLMKR